MNVSRGGTLVWFRQDLRIADNPALDAACRTGEPITPVYIWGPEEEGGWAPGAASKWWLHHSLNSLGTDLRRLGTELVLRRGAAQDVLLRLLRETGARRVLWNRRYEPYARARDEKVKTTLQAAGYETESFNSALLHEPWLIQNRSGKPFQVFTPFWKTCMAAGEKHAPLLAPGTLSDVTKAPTSLKLDELELLPELKWADGFSAVWQPGETGAWRALDQFQEQAFEGYNDGRNRPDQPGTSRLSPHLHFGEISPRQIWAKIADEGAKAGAVGWERNQFVTELGWREFAYHLLYHFPETVDQPLRTEFRDFPWREDQALLRAWQRGQTGVPLVDAGMRELWQTGWMHFLVRMVVGSFLVKNLLIKWQEGARWFWDTLVDADLASNTLGWQWVAGCGADAAPYFRVFNPVLQGEKFDSEGRYVRTYVPELNKVPDRWVHQPWLAPGDRIEGLFSSGYPQPVTSLYASREAALAAYARMKGKA